MTRLIRLAIVLLAALAAMQVLGCAGGSRRDPIPPRPGEFCGLWITRWDYRTADDVRLAIGNAASLGVTDIIWQVRGQCDAFYPSAIEPWGQELLVGGMAPGFDPLRVAVEETHARGLRLHAWINVMPLWKGTIPPANPNHPLYTRPEWRLIDQHGEPQPLNDHYVIVNPVREDVHRHVAAVCRDIATRYPVDGIHLDYIRFVSDTMGEGSFYPADAESLDRAETALGTRPDIATPAGRAVLRAWIATRITDLVRRIRAETNAARPGVQLTAAVWRRPDLAHEPNLQFADEWLMSGMLDRVLPMIYTDDHGRFTSDLRAWLEAAPGRAISPGIGTYKHAPGMTPEQGELTRGASGFSIFGYSALFESVDPNQDRSRDARRARAGLRRDVGRYIWSRRDEASP